MIGAGTIRGFARPAYQQIREIFKVIV